MSVQRVAIGVLVAFLAVCGSRPGAAAPDAGQVLAFSGQCFSEANGKRTPLKLGDKVHVGDTMQVPEGAKLRLRMNDGSVISVASGGRMTIQDVTTEAGGERKDVKLALVSGLIHAVVAPTSAPSRFEVDTATGVASVRSTDWFIDAERGTTKVAVLDGVVTVSGTARTHDVEVPRRSATVVESGRVPAPVRPVSDAEFASLIARTNLLGSGLCQCIEDKSMLQAYCEPNTQACESFCNGRHYSYLPRAPDSCSAGLAMPNR